MSNTGKFKKATPIPALDKHEEGSSTVHGRITYDDLGNKVWEPYSELSTDDTVAMLLKGSGLSVTEDDSPAAVRRVKPNPAGVVKGYDPYDSGMLTSNEQKKKKKDLRALSKWIAQKKKLEQDP